MDFEMMRAMSRMGPPPPFPFPGLPPMEFGKVFQNYHHPPPPIHQHDSPTQLRKLFIGGLNHETTDAQLGHYFSQWGPVIDAVVIRDPVSKCSRGFGFVTFRSVFSAELAMSSKPHVLGGRTVDSKRAIPREQMSSAQLPADFFDHEPAPGCKLTIIGILDGIHSVAGLRAYFETFGVLEQVEICGYHGSVIFESRDSADRCAAHNNGIHVVNDMKVEVKVDVEVVPYGTPSGHFECHSGTNTDCEDGSEEEAATTMI